MSCALLLRIPASESALRVEPLCELSLVNVIANPGARTRLVNPPRELPSQTWRAAMPCSSSRPSNPASEPDVRVEPPRESRRAAVPCEPLLRIPASESVLRVEPLREAALRAAPPTSDGGKISPWCVHGPPSVAIFSRDASLGGHPWQFFAVVRSRAAIRGNFLASCIPEGASDGKSAPSWQHIAAMYPKRAGIGKICAPCIRKAPQIAFRECIARRSCQGGALFAALTPRIMHGARILLSLASERERVRTNRENASVRSLSGKGSDQAKMPTF